MDFQREKSLNEAISMIEKKFGKGTIMKMSDKPKMEIDIISSGSLLLDNILGGGIPKGRIIEVFGPESSGKTTVALNIIKEVQKNGGVALFIDAEHALDPIYAKKIGVDVENLIVSQPDYGEQALEIAENMARSGAIDVVVIDSVAALVPKAEIEGEMGDMNVGLQARLISQAMRKLVSVLGKTGCTAIFINQIREKVGVMFGNPETTPGGRALKFYSSIRLDVRRGDLIKEEGEIVGHRIKVKVVKNKIAPPFKETELYLLYNSGISRVDEILELSLEKGIVEKSGAWFRYNGQSFQGKENLRQFIINNISEFEGKIL